MTITAALLVTYIHRTLFDEISIVFCYMSACIGDKFTTEQRADELLNAANLIIKYLITYYYKTQRAYSF